MCLVITEKVSPLTWINCLTSMNSKIHIVLIRACQWNVSYTRWMSINYFFNSHLNIILSSNPKRPKWFPSINFFWWRFCIHYCIHLVSILCVLCAPAIWFALISSLNYTWCRAWTFNGKRSFRGGGFQVPRKLGAMPAGAKAPGSITGSGKWDRRSVFHKKIYWGGGLPSGLAKPTHLTN
jgi:hypothetical protein